MCTDLYEAHQRARFMRPDAARWMRPDAARWIRPDVERFLIPGSNPADVFPALDRKYNPSQPRVPAGSGRPSGRWTDAGGTQGTEIDEGGSTASAGPMSSNNDLGDVRDKVGSLGLVGITPREETNEGHVQLVSDDGKPILDEFGEPYYARRGHHEMPQAIAKDLEFSSEARTVFDGSTTGRLPAGRTIVDDTGSPVGHFWDNRHRQYSDGVRELTDRFLSDNNIDPRQMTADQTGNLLKEIRETDDPRIRNYNATIRMLRRILRFRGRE
jgi:hypothetical protein